MKLPISEQGPFSPTLSVSQYFYLCAASRNECDATTSPVLTPRFSHENLIIMDRHKSFFILALFAIVVNQSLQFSIDRPRPYLPFTLIRTKDVMEDPKVKETAKTLQRATEILQEIIDHANMLEGMKR